MGKGTYGSKRGRPKKGQALYDEMRRASANRRVRKSPVMAGTKKAADAARAKVKRPVKATTKKVASPVKRKSSPTRVVKKKVSKKVSKAVTKKTTPTSKSASQTFRQEMKKASKVKANRTKSYDFSKTKVKTSEQLAKERRQRRLKNAAESISPAVMAATGVGGLAAKQGVKALGGGKAAVRTGRRVLDRLKQERQKRKEGRGFEDSYGGIVKKTVKSQRSSVKRRNTIAKNKAASESKRIKTAENAYRRGDITKRELQAIRAEAPKNITKPKKGNVSKADVKRRRGPRAKPKR